MYKVLIVDDEPFILKGLERLINWEEYNLEIVAQASNGLLALEVLVNSRIDILITDIKMPKMVGLDLIQNIRDRHLNTKCIILSGYDDFPFLKEAIKLGIENYLLKPVNIDELISTLQSTVNKIENELIKQIKERKDTNILMDNVLNRWISGDISESNLIERLSLLEMKIENKMMLVILVKIFFETVKSDFNINNDKNLLRFDIINICSEVINEYSTSFVFQEWNGDIAIILSSKDDLLEKHVVKSVLEKIITNINSLLNVDVLITVGSIVNNYMDLYKSCYHSKNLQEYSLLLNFNQIIFYEDILQIHDNKNIHIDMTPLKTYIIAREKKACIDFLNQVFSMLKLSEGIKPSHIQNTSIDALYNVVTALKVIYPEGHELSNGIKESFSYVFKIQNFDELLKWLIGIIEQCFIFLINEDQKMSPIIRKTLDLILSNYCKDINLSTLSFELNVNPVYLGQLFKNEVRETFNNYINKIRVEKAKDLLLNSNLKANEISKKVGYLSETYFYTIFKKIVGISPTEFKGK